MIIAVILGIFAVILALLFIPLNLFISFDEDFNAKITYFGFKINTNKSSKKSVSSKNTEEKQDNIFKRLYKENNLKEFINILISLLKTVFNQLKFILKHIKIYNLDLKIWVATEDAAKTAIEYGVVSTAVYNFLQFVSSITKLKLKKVDIYSDFESKKSKIKFSPIFLIISAVVILKSLTNITNKKGSVTNER